MYIYIYIVIITIIIVIAIIITPAPQVAFKDRLAQLLGLDHQMLFKFKAPRR